jgi:hypothetical protein
MMGHLGSSYCHLVLSLSLVSHAFTFYYPPSCSGINSLRLFISTFDAHRVASSKTTPTMPQRRSSQCLHPDEAPPQEPINHPPLNQPSTRILPTIDKSSKHPVFGNIPEAQLHQPAHTSTNIAGLSQTNGAATLSHIGGGAPHQSPL